VLRNVILYPSSSANPLHPSHILDLDLVRVGLTTCEVNRLRGRRDAAPVLLHPTMPHHHPASSITELQTPERLS